MEAEINNRVRTAEHLRFQLSLETLRRFCNSACPVVIIMLGPVRPATVMGVQGCPKVCVDWLDDSYRLFRQNATSVAVHVDQMTTDVAFKLGRPVRLGVRFQITALRY